MVKGAVKVELLTLQGDVPVCVQRRASDAEIDAVCQGSRRQSRGQKRQQQCSSHFLPLEFNGVNGEEKLAEVTWQTSR